MVDNIVDITVWIMWTAFIAYIFYHFGHCTGMEDGYVVGWNGCIESLGGLLR
jgi:hypothetical protein